MRPRAAFVIHRDGPGSRETRLGRILTFFGVPWKPVGIRQLREIPVDGERRLPSAVLMASADVLAEALPVLRSSGALPNVASVYAYASEDPQVFQRVVESICGGNWRVHRSPAAPSVVEIPRTFPEFTGPMGGVKSTVTLAPHDFVVQPAPGATCAVDKLVTVAEGALLIRTTSDDVSLHVCASASIPDIDQAVAGNYYDVKDQFASAVPLVMFIQSTFRDAIWRANELGACLIIDDPLLKHRYGFCDFRQLRDLMKAHQFTTNIAFIPWNWRRTTKSGSEFFRREGDLFSISVHGCDHVAGEFGAASDAILERKARLARSRMRGHHQRTGLEHDSIMVFPQGVFSAQCPAILKRNGFVAVVNTEVSPANDHEPRTTVRDVWDTAILSYGSFPIYTRRYPFHGLENFAFDLLLGKPCFIVAHHDFFRDRGAALVALLDQLKTLNATLHWQSPLQVIRRAYRRRTDDGVERIQMFATEALLTNSADTACEFAVEKREADVSLIQDVHADEHTLSWTPSPHGLTFRHRVAAGGESLVTVVYRESAVTPAQASVKYQLSVATRRILSEFRDEYVQKLYPAGAGSARK